jgi:NAD(P)-dependent dehydrogenase (short-subunit alcohol dehydrogenase family)
MGSGKVPMKRDHQISDPKKVRIPSFLLDGRVAVVTGASQGIGRAFAHAYAAAGAHVIIGSRTRESFELVRDEIRALGGSADAFKLDVCSVASIEAFFSHVEEAATPSAPMVLMNNAGNAFTKAALEVTEDDWDYVIDTHVKGTFFCARAGARLMLARGYGKIINMSSTWSASTNPNKSVYCAAKAAISHMTAALATEWAPRGVRVTAIAPTAVLTTVTQQTIGENKEFAQQLLSRIPLGRYEVTDDLIGTALFLASEASDFITGQTIFVDGGWNGAR